MPESSELKGSGLRVKDVMTKGVITGKADDTLPAIARIMAGKGISSLVIVNSADEAVGIISSLDLVKAFANRSTEQIKKTRAEEIMTHPVYDVSEEMMIEEVANIMVIKNIHRVVVSAKQGRSKNKKPAGILSATDIVKVLTKLNE